MAGRLYLVATPIGNLEDMTFRAVRILREVDVIAAEDTRASLTLLNHFEIKKPLISLHEQNERSRMDELLGRMEQGQNIAVISDAGTPVINDPGFLLVREVAQRGWEVIPIPGANALITALCASGLPPAPMVFHGFSRRSRARRRQILAESVGDWRTQGFYESPRRVLGLLEDVRALWGNRPCVLARELTKIHEEFLRGTVDEVHAVLSARDTVRGECVLLVAGAAEPQVDSAEDLDEAIDLALEEGTRPTEIAAKVADRGGMTRQEAYRRVLDRQRLLREASAGD